MNTSQLQTERCCTAERDAKTHEPRIQSMQAKGITADSSCWAPTSVHARPRSRAHALLRARLHHALLGGLLGHHLWLLWLHHATTLQETRRHVSPRQCTNLEGKQQKSPATFRAAANLQQQRSARQQNQRRTGPMLGCIIWGCACGPMPYCCCGAPCIIGCCCCCCI